MSNLPEQIDQTIDVRVLFRRGQKVLVAVSGGVDSMVLLNVLEDLSKKRKWRLTVAHLNHQLRGRSSDADERVVVRAAKKFGLPIIVERANVKELARTGKLSLEMAARKARHEFLARTAARLKIPNVALAHHADDQVELFFLRLLRGSGSEGLAGMKWRNPSPANPRIELVRPLLERSKESLRDYAVAKKIQFREDASNEWLDIQRNLIRHELLPLLRRKHQPAVDRIVLRLMDMLGAESEVVNAAAQEWLAPETKHRSKTPGKKAFAKLPIALQRRCVQLQLLRHGIPADFGLVERLRASPSRPFTILPEVVVSRDSNGILHFHTSEPVVSKPARINIHLNSEAGEIVFNSRKILWKISRQETFQRPRPQPGRELFDADKVGSRVILRHWQPGDRFQPIGMANSAKLQDLFTNQRIPRLERHELVVATTADNEVFWVEGLRIAERFKLTSATKRCLKWQWKRG